MELKTEKIEFPAPSAEWGKITHFAICGEVPRFRYLPRWLMRWRIFRKQAIVLAGVIKP